MKRPAIAKLDRQPAVGARNRRGERGVTMVLVASAMVAIMAMAALSIDVVTLYLANAEAQRSADTAALAAARILSISGMTGDPQNTSGNWQAACDMATQVATSVANQNVVNGTVPSTVNVTFPNDPSGDCTDAGVATVFGVNPVVQVQVQRINLPTFFARIWGHKGATVSGTATAEAFNSSNSASYAAALIGVQPRCVKPWIVGNGPKGSSYVDPTSGAILNASMQPGGVIGSPITLVPDPNCNITGCFGVEGTTVLKNQYIAASVQGTPVAVAAGASGDIYQEAIGGCDQTTVYACGTVGGTNAELSVNLGTAAGDTFTATQILINSTTGGQDTFNNGLYPFQIRAGLGNPLVVNGLVNDDDVITSSNSIVTIPLMDTNTPVPPTDPAPVTIVGFLQVFIQSVSDATVKPPAPVTVQGYILNVVGCGNATPPASVNGSSPVPVRLVTYP